MSDPDPEIQRYLRCHWFSGVQELADLDLQKITWLDRQNSNPHWSYVEFCCSYPMEDQLAEAHAHRWLTDEEVHLLRTLNEAISAHSSPTGNDYDHEAILQDPAWLEVVELAKRTQQRLLAIVENEDERAALRDRPDLAVLMDGERAKQPPTS